MSKPYSKFSTRTTPQSESIPGKNQVRNNAGGFVFEIDDWKRLERFLVLGTEGGTYYVQERAHTVDNADVVLRCIAADGVRTVEVIREISLQGRAPKNSPALFALALASAHGDLKTRQFAFEVLPQVARIGTHLFEFLNYRSNFAGWSRVSRRGVANWYLHKDADRLAYQVIKYRNREGWTHLDAIRLSHPAATEPKTEGILQWLAGKVVHNEDLPDLINAFVEAQNADVGQVINLITDYDLPREALPTHLLNDVHVWAALLEKMPITAMIRNLGKMTNLGLIAPMSAASKQVVERLTTKTILQRGRVHPLSVLAAMVTYQNGKGMKGSLTWNPVSQVVDALDSAFYLSFGNVTPTNKRLMLALDVSGSMSGGWIAGSPLSPREASSAMALVTAAVEPQYMTMAFSGGFMPLSLSPRERLDDVVHRTRNMPFDRTDCAQPMLFAMETNRKIDAFIIYTDNETWVGKIHPVQALDAYCQKTGIPAKLVTVGMTATRFSIADPSVSTMLDVVGFDTGTPNVISDFVVGE